MWRHDAPILDRIHSLERSNGKRGMWGQVADNRAFCEELRGRLWSEAAREISRLERHPDDIWLRNEWPEIVE